MAVSKK